MLMYPTDPSSHPGPPLTCGEVNSRKVLASVTAIRPVKSAVIGPWGPGRSPLESGSEL